MAKKKAATAAKLTDPTSNKTTVKKAKKKGDLPGQKVMPHGPKKVPELETIGAEYIEAEAAVEAAKERLHTAEGKAFDTLKKKRLKSYSVAGREFYRKPGGENLGVRKIKQ